MPKTMEIILPDEMAHYEGELRYFIDSMVRKLFVNRHKGFAEGVSWELATDLLKGEIEEMGAAVRDREPQFAAYMETVDVANMAFIAGLVLSRMTKNEYKAIGGNDVVRRDTTEGVTAAARSPVDNGPYYPKAECGRTQPRGGDHLPVADEHQPKSDC